MNTYNITNAVNDIVNSINQLETKVSLMEAEFNSLHVYLDRMSVPRWSESGNTLYLSDRMDLLASRGEIKFEIQEIV